MDGETIFLTGLGGFLLGRAIWQSVAHQRHLAWIAAASGPIGLIGIMIDQDWLFVVGIGLLVVGEFLYQTNDELSPAELTRLRDDLHPVHRHRWRRTRPCSDSSRSQRDD